MKIMRAGFNRRDLIKGALTAGAISALPGFARASGSSPEFQRAFDMMVDAGPNPGAIAPAIVHPASMAPAAIASTRYSQRVIAIAIREIERAGPQVMRRDVVAVADFARPSSLPRFHFVDLQSGTLRSYLVAHGRGSDPEHDGWLKNFSNVIGSEATSRGAYLVGDNFTGKYGTSLRLQGLDPDNSNAYDRAIVMHPAWYAAPDMLARWGKLGRSEGCFAMDPEYFGQSLAQLAGGRLLFADRIEDV